ncbi:uncharacterized protein PFL1_01173 [Pseudozyma flocculosa PF-1]|uniref:uncharacterized protein n=1 Tax=Pseudozyma flocculosa PF-1 TaxID=1277687 RepID=UPI0004561346|nr:uncharacterized protein PFL1_01173 [Pseudozyma flocculosa PF-1]EPQ30984.1 hypothetical protein PFL1_01173 [Pseudozyma flocculosa PF-1]
MSFGRPPTFSNFSVLPPERGSFPLDHEGECKQVMVDYLRCMKDNRADNGKCRQLSKQYLQCRMDKGLMDKDDMKNLGFQETDQAVPASSSSSSQQQSPTPAATAGKGSGAKAV